MLQREQVESFAVFAALSMPEQVFLQAALLHARFDIETPDALGLACVQHHRCEALWTNDNRLAVAPYGLTREFAP